MKKCEFDKNRLEAMFPKKQASKKQSHAIHAHAHVHTSQPQHHAKPPKHAHPTHTSCIHVWESFFMHLLWP